MVYAAKVNDVRHTFQPSGSLWRDALVMQDLETESLWSQPTGECIQGKLEGSVLSLIPAIHTTYAEFKKQYPHGQLLKKEEKGPEGAPYAEYYADSTKLGIFGRIDDYERLPGKTLVVGLRLAGGEVAVSMDYLEEHGSATVGENPKIVVTYDSKSKTVSANQAKPGNKMLGDAFPVITSYWFAWASFFPETELIK